MIELKRLLELAGVTKGPTIADATMKDGEINRTTADAILDPKGYFAHNKKKMHEDGWTHANNYENSVEAAEAYAFDNFTADGFIDSEVFRHDIGYDQEDPVTREQVMGALTYYLREFINLHYMEGGESHEADTTDLAKAVYDQVRDAMEAKGMIISD